MNSPGEFRVSKEIPDVVYNMLYDMLVLKIRLKNKNSIAEYYNAMSHTSFIKDRFVSWSKEDFDNHWFLFIQTTRRLSYNLGHKTDDEVLQILRHKLKHRLTGFPPTDDKDLLYFFKEECLNSEEYLEKTPKGDISHYKINMRPLGDSISRIVFNISLNEPCELRWSYDALDLQIDIDYKAPFLYDNESKAKVLDRARKRVYQFISESDFTTILLSSYFLKKGEIDAGCLGIKEHKMIFKYKESSSYRYELYTIYACNQAYLVVHAKEIDKNRAYATMGIALEEVNFF